MPRFGLRCLDSIKSISLLIEFLVNIFLDRWKFLFISFFLDAGQNPSFKRNKIKLIVFYLIDDALHNSFVLGFLNYFIMHNFHHSCLKDGIAVSSFLLHLNDLLIAPHNASFVRRFFIEKIFLHFDLLSFVCLVDFFVQCFDFLETLGLQLLKFFRRSFTSLLLCR